VVRKYNRGNVCIQKRQDVDTKCNGKIVIYRLVVGYLYKV
jgi:hypothetical protein